LFFTSEITRRRPDRIPHDLNNQRTAVLQGSMSLAILINPVRS
jgi:hypothetical protein